MQENLKSRLRLGYIVFGALIASKVVEYIIVNLVQRGAWPYLIVVAFIGAWLIVVYFMHVLDLRGSGKDDE